MPADIERLLRQKKPSIDRAIERGLPRRLNARLLAQLTGKLRYSAPYSSAERSVHAPIWALLDRGGKRWRPALFLLIAEAFGANPRKLEDLAAVAEVVHNGTLMVDDVEDDSDLRRGKPALHKLYGVDVAVNAGNAMYFLPLRAFRLHRRQFSDSVMLAAYETYAQEMANLSYGQGFDIWWHHGHDEGVSERDYLQMCAFKTGTLARLSAKLGALFAGASSKDVELAGEFAEAIGIAFQIQDDLLNLQADVQEYGKEIGGDISEGKRTLITLHALRHASAKDRKRLRAILNAHTKDPKRIRQAIEIVRQAGSMEYAAQVARKLVSHAWAHFAPRLKKGRAKDALESFAGYLVERRM